MTQIVIMKVAECSGFYYLTFYKNEFGITSKNYPKELFNGKKPKKYDLVDTELKDGKLVLSFNGIVLSEN